MSYIQLHTFTEHSIGYGICNIKEYVIKAKEFGYEHLGIKCKGSLLGSLEFHHKCKQENLNPVICVDLNIPTGADNSPAFPLTLYAKNEEGYDNLLLLSKADRDGRVLNKDLLGSHNAGLIASSAGIHGEIVHYLKTDESEKAIEVADEYQKIFGDFYIELIPGTYEVSQQFNNSLYNISRKLDLRTLANHNVNFLNKVHLKPFLVSQYLHAGQPYKFVEKEYETYKDCYLHSCDEIKTLFPGEQEAIDNSELLAESCSLKFTEQTPKLPEFKLPSGFTNAEEYLRYLVEIGLRKLFLDDVRTQKIQDQIEKELDYVIKKNQSGYFLIISDLIQWARSNNIFVQNTMGVSSGSMLYYILGITQINPNEFNLLFESCLSFITGKVSPVVLSVDKEGWEPLINYMKSKYGHDHVSNVISYKKRSDPELIEECAKTLVISIQNLGFYDFIMQHEDLWSDISDSYNKRTVSLMKEKMKLSPIKALQDLVQEIGMDKQLYKNWLNGFVYRAECNFIDDFNQYIKEKKINIEDSQINLFFKTLIVLRRKIESYDCSQNRIGISKDTITSLLPSINDDVRGIGLIDNSAYSCRSVYLIDILVDDSMSVLKNCQNMIQRTERDFDIQNIAADNVKSFNFLNSILYTDNCFLIPGFGCDGFQDILAKVKPSCIDDLIACFALAQPHLIKMVDFYITGKQSPDSVIFEHPALEDILGSTYGVILYKEQMMNLIHKVSHIPVEETNKLRRMLNLNKDKYLSDYENEFILKTFSNGYSKNEASEIFNLIRIHSPRLISKAALVNRAYRSYQFLYCIAHHPDDFNKAQKWRSK